MVVSLGDTFLTEGNPMDIPEPEAMARCREEHSRLQTVVFSLNQKISQVLAKQEGDFLAAYRAHMYTVQKELQTLRQRVVEAENVLQVRYAVTYTFVRTHGNAYVNTVAEKSHQITKMRFMQLL